LLPCTPFKECNPFNNYMATASEGQVKTRFSGFWLLCFGFSTMKYNYRTTCHHEF
jgi:hypothetical protein